MTLSSTSTVLVANATVATGATLLLSPFFDLFVMMISDRDLQEQDQDTGGCENKNVRDRQTDTLCCR
jgi:hypothetical protein